MTENENWDFEWSERQFGPVRPSKWKAVKLVAGGPVEGDPVLAAELTAVAEMQLYERLYRLVGNPHYAMRALDFADEAKVKQPRWALETWAALTRTGGAYTRKVIDEKQAVRLDFEHAIVEQVYVFKALRLPLADADQVIAAWLAEHPLKGHASRVKLATPGRIGVRKIRLGHVRREAIRRDVRKWLADGNAYLFASVWRQELQQLKGYTKLLRNLSPRGRAWLKPRK